CDGAYGSQKRDTKNSHQRRGGRNDAFGRFRDTETASRPVNGAESRASLALIRNNRRRLDCLAGAPGFEPGNAGIKIRCLTTWLRPNGTGESQRTIFRMRRLDHSGADPFNQRSSLIHKKQRHPLTGLEPGLDYPAMSYRAPVADIAFTLKHAAGLKTALAEGIYGDLDEETVDSVLAEAARYASDVIAPLNSIGDKFGTPFKDGKV